jgi:SDR family mycofactocin-dependent oxidoreductase
VETDLDGKVVLITGAARGQGRSHAVRFAEEGANVIAIDICDQIDSVAYPMASPEDLDETVNLVEKTGRRVVAAQVDVRDLKRMNDVVHQSVADLGRLDFVLANAGILPGVGASSPKIEAFLDAVDVMLKGVYFTIEASLPELLKRGQSGGAIVITSSAAAFTSLSPSFATRNHGTAGYVAAKHGVVGLMRYYATTLAEKNIRVNCVHPGGVATPLLLNEPLAQYVADHPEFAELIQVPLPGVTTLETSDVTDAMVYLCARSGRYITGTSLLVDAGCLLK